MEDDSLIKRYESFLKLNHLEISKESAEDFTDMQENITPLMLSMEYVNKGVLLKSLISRKKYFNNALIIEPNNFAAKICNLELTSFSLDEYKNLLDKEYERLLSLNYLDPAYYQNKIVDFIKYQETFNYLRGIRSYYIALLSASKIDEAIKVAQEILELNPNDFFHISGSLAILYLAINDTVSAEFLIQSKTNLIVGTKELVYAYSSFLNKDNDKALEYLSDLENCNPYLYRLLTGEADIDLLNHKNDDFSDACYVFIHFSIIGKTNKEFDEILKKSEKAHPLLDDLTKDEILVLEAITLDEMPYINLNSIKEASLKYNLVKEISLYQDGRILGIIDSLLVRGIIRNSILTIYGKLFKRRIEEALDEIKNNKLKEALKFIEEGSKDIGLAILKDALDYNPYDYNLKKLYLFNQSFFDFNMAKNLIEDITIRIKKLEGFYESLDYKLLQELIIISDEISYRYYSEALKGGINSLILSYTRIENAFIKYTYLIQMAQVINNDIFSNDEIHEFYMLYKEYKELGKLNYDRIIRLLKNSKMLYAQVKMKSNLIPFKLLDPKFSGNLERAIDLVSIDEIINKEEMEFLLSFYEDNNENDLKSIEPIFIENTYKFLKSLWIIYDKDKKDYVLAPFVKEFLKNL